MVKTKEQRLVSYQGILLRLTKAAFGLLWVDQYKRLWKLLEENGKIQKIVYMGILDEEGE